MTHPIELITVSPMNPKRGTCEGCGADLWDIGAYDIVGNGTPQWVPVHDVPSWIPMVTTFSDRDGRYTGNLQRYATREEADAKASEIMARWMAVRDIRVEPSADPVNYRRENGRDVSIDAHS